MSNPWGIKLKKTGLVEHRINTEQSNLADLEKRQAEMAKNIEADREKKNIYEERQASLAVDAMTGQQERLGGRRKIRKTKVKKNKKLRKSRKSKKSKKSKRHTRGYKH
jgi:hypothetical protein